MISFFGLALPERIQSQLGTLTSGLPNVNWVDQSDLHLTLRYLGDMNQLDLEDLLEEISLLKAPSLELTLQGLGVFPKSGDPRTLWVGVSPCPQLIALRNKIERTCQRFGMEPEHRKFLPHITIGRMESTPLPRLLDYLESYHHFKTEPFTLKEFHLYSSHRQAIGATYSIEASFKLL